MAFNSNGLLTDRITVVTGAGRGIGRAITELFLAQGAHVYGVVRQAESLIDLSVNSRLHTFVGDVTDEQTPKRLIQTIKSEVGRLDVLVKNAGVMTDALLGMISEQQIKTTMGVNIVGPLQFIQWATRLMKRQQSGSIINLASIIGTQGKAGQVLYSTSKGAIVSMTRSAAKELAPYGIRVNALAPGMIQTELLEGLPSAAREAAAKAIGMKRIGAPDDVAQVALFLASDMARYVTGQIIGIDGAMVV